MGTQILKISVLFVVAAAFTILNPGNATAVSMSKITTNKTLFGRLDHLTPPLRNGLHEDCRVCDPDTCIVCWGDLVTAEPCPPTSTQEPCEECGTCPTCEPCIDPTNPEPCHCPTPDPPTDPTPCPTEPPCPTQAPCEECPTISTTIGTSPPPPISGYPRFSKAIYQSSLPSWPTAGTTIRLGINATTDDGAPVQYRLLTSFEFLTLSSTNDIIFTSNVSDGAFVGPNNVMIIEIVARVIWDETRESSAAVIIIFPRSSRNEMNAVNEL